MSAALQVLPAVQRVQVSELQELVRMVPLAEHQALLNTWTPLEYFRHAARQGVSRQQALRDCHECRRCRGMARPRLYKVAADAYAGMYQQAADAAEAFGDAAPCVPGTGSGRPEMDGPQAPRLRVLPKPGERYE